jgi:hypothetical protein
MLAGGVSQPEQAKKNVSAGRSAVFSLIVEK